MVKLRGSNLGTPAALVGHRCRQLAGSRGRFDHEQRNCRASEFGKILRYCSTIKLQALAPKSVGGRSRILLAACASVVALTGLMIRLLIHAMPVGRVNSDEAIAGLMARHFARGEWTTFYWGQSYAGSLEMIVTGAIMKVTGSDVFAFYAVPFVESLLVAGLTFLIARNHVGRDRAIFAGLLVWVFPAAWVLLSTKAMLFYQPTLIFGLTAVLAADSLIQRNRSRLIVWFGFGLVLGLGWWCSFQILFFAVPAIVWLLVRRGNRFAEWLVALVGGLIGASPWLVYYIKYDGLPLKQLAGGQGGYVDHLNSIVTAGLPMAVGGRQPYTERWLTLGAGPLVPILILGAIATAVVVCCRNRVVWHPLFLVALVFVPLHALAAGAFYVGSGRYFIFLAPTVAFCIVSCTRRLSILAGLSVFAALVSGATIWGIRDAYVAPPSTAPVGRLLESRQIRHVYASYWVAYKLTWESHEAVRAASDFDRYPLWSVEARSAASAAYVMYLPIAQDEHRYEAVVDGLKDQSIAYEEFIRGAYVVIIPERNVAPEALGLAG